MGKNRAFQKIIFALILTAVAAGTCFCTGGAWRSVERVYAPVSGNHGAARALQAERPSERPAAPRAAMLAALILIFGLVLYLPFHFAFKELIKPKDSEIPYIDPEYTKDEMFFQKSFKELIFDALGKDPPVGRSNALLSKYEKVAVYDTLKLNNGTAVAEVLYVKGNLAGGDNVILEKEAYVAGNAVLGKGSIVRAIAAKGDIALGENTKVIRWIGAEKNIIVGNNSELGARAACYGKLQIGRNCGFKYISGSPVITFSSGACANEPEDHWEIRNMCDTSWCVDGKSLSIPQGTKVEKDLIVQGDLNLGSGCELTGNIKAHGNVRLEEKATVNGNVFCDGNIFIGKDCRISGDIFSLKEVRIASCTEVGRAGQTKSVIAKRKLELGKDVIVHGHCLSENIGVTL